MGARLYQPEPMPSITPNWEDRQTVTLDAGRIVCLADWGCIVPDKEWSPTDGKPGGARNLPSAKRR